MYYGKYYTGALMSLAQCCLLHVHVTWYKSRNRHPCYNWQLEYVKTEVYKLPENLADGSYVEGIIP